MILHRMPSLGVSSLDLGRFRVAFFLRQARDNKAEPRPQGKPETPYFAAPAALNLCLHP